MAHLLQSKPTAEAEDLIRVRNEMLAALPLPLGFPDEVLSPIVIPRPLTLHEFLGSVSGVSPFYDPVSY
jgi:hypothetical protein